jgi:hypothetical protein
MSNAAPDTPQAKKVSNKPGDQVSTTTTTTTTDSYFKLPFEHNPNTRLSSSARRAHHNSYSKRSDFAGNSLLDRWTEFSSEDSYSSRPQDCFSTEVSDSSDTTMASNLRAELEKSRPFVSVSPSASVRQLVISLHHDFLFCSTSVSRLLTQLLSCITVIDRKDSANTACPISQH